MEDRTDSVVAVGAVQAEVGAVVMVVEWSKMVVKIEKGHG